MSGPPGADKVAFRAFTLRSIDLVPSVGKVSQVVTVHKGGTEKPSASVTKSRPLTDEC
jgi:hypothetical protein